MRSSVRACFITIATFGAMVIGVVACGPDVEQPRLSLAAEPQQVQQGLEADTAAALTEAIAIYEASRLERLVAAVDEFERFESMYAVGGVANLANNGDTDTLFFLGDEAFEFERDRAAGFGQGPRDGAALPAKPQRVHDGERGGLDSSSCRSCHFSGGPDGAGRYTQVALLRGDGDRLSSAVVRDAPHVMGVGYIQLMAEWFTLVLESQAINHTFNAEATGLPILANLEVDGIDFGNVTFYPDGTRNSAGLRAIDPDLVVRPFGHKGRHATLVELVEEALQIHHGHQSTSREQDFAERADADAFLGPGRAGDRDHDGVDDEISPAQAVVLATYLSMLPIPIRQEPERADLLQVFSRGSQVFSDVGCNECHRRELRMQIEGLAHVGGGDSTLFVPLIPGAVGQRPRPERLDFGSLVPGVPIYPFTDLRRHDLGEALADVRPEVLPSGGVVAPEVWLTRSLWGLADTAPYLHDGRAPTVHDAIALHGGEATAARLAYLGRSDDDQAALRVYLLSLTRVPTLLVQ